MLEGDFMQRFITLLLFILSISGTAFAQWEKTGWHDDPDVYSLCASGDIIALGTSAGLMLSGDKGRAWVSCAERFPSLSLKNALAISGGRIFAQNADLQLCISADTGKSWTISSTPANILHLAFAGGMAIAAAKTAIYISGDSGSSWRQVRAGLDKEIYGVGACGSRIIALTDGGVWFSPDSGSTWIARNNGLPGNKKIRVVAAAGDIIMAGTGEADLPSGSRNEIFISSDMGLTWTAGNNDKLKKIAFNLSAAGSNFIAWNYSSIFVSTDNGTTWINRSDSLSTYDYSVATDGSLIYFWAGGALYSSSDFCATRTLIHKGTYYGWVYSLASLGSTLFAAAGAEISGMGGGIYSSTDDGMNWKIKAFESREVDELLTAGNCLLAKVDNDYLLSSDGGGSWKRINSDSSVTLRSAISSGNCFIFEGTGGVYVTSVPGIYPKFKYHGLPAEKYVKPLAASGSNFYAIAGDTVYVSSDAGENWAAANIGLHLPLGGVYAAARGNNCLISDRYNVFSSTDGGRSWHAALTGLPYFPDIASFFFLKDNDVFAASGGKGLFLSPNAGSYWIYASYGLENMAVTSMAVCGDYVYASTTGLLNSILLGGIFRARLSSFVGIEENPAKEEFIIRPALAGDYVSIIPGSITDSQGNMKISVYSSAGLKMFETRCSEKIFVGGLAPGVYFIVIGTKAFKFIKI